MEYLKFMLSQAAPGALTPQTAGDALWDGQQESIQTQFQADPLQQALYRILQQGAGGPNNAVMAEEFLKR
jgi:hypothetical protein